jgi:hypothetical protein
VVGEYKEKPFEGVRSVMNDELDVVVEMEKDE